MALYDLFGIEIHAADETAFATKESSFSGRDVRALAIPTVDLKQNTLEDKPVSNRLNFQYAPILALQNGSKLTLQIALRGTGTAASDGVSAIGEATLAEGQLLKNMFGGESLGMGGVATADSTTAHINTDDVAYFSAGQAVLVNGEANVIDAVTASGLSMVRCFSAAPAAADVIYASATYYPTQELPEETLQFRCTDGSGDSWYLEGCQGNSITFAGINVGEKPVCNLDIHVTAWEAGADALAAPTYTNATQPAIPGNASKLYVGDYGWEQICEIDAAAVVINPGLSCVPVGSVSGTQGVQKHGRAAPVKPSIEFVTPYTDDYRDDFEALTAKYLHYQIGSTAGATILIEVPRFFIDAKPAPATLNGQRAVKVTGYGAELTSGSTDLVLAPVKIHLL